MPDMLTLPHDRRESSVYVFTPPTFPPRDLRFYGKPESKTVLMYYNEINPLISKFVNPG